MKHAPLVPIRRKDGASSRRMHCRETVPLFQIVEQERQGPIENRSRITTRETVTQEILHLP